MKYTNTDPERIECDASTWFDVLGYALLDQIPHGKPDFFIGYRSSNINN